MFTLIVFAACVFDDPAPTKKQLQDKAEEMKLRQMWHDMRGMTTKEMCAYIQLKGSVK
jgi:hypothetical protein